ncbi:MAG: GTP-binding protein [Syntrophomonadaceae bacterium]|nr:GTP-binding protein [Syntrophomonadaceae bacterium]
MQNTKETLRIVVVGHVDHGKSTVIGRLLYDTKSLPEGAIERVKRISRENGKPFEYAYLLDAFEEEQKQNITIDTTQLQFHTEKREYVIIDAPGHKEFLKNMISGAANAEAALLVIDAKEGIREQSKRHGYMLSLLGIRKVYVLVNKMDLIDYSESKFSQIKYEMNRFLNGLNVFPLKYIPVSAILGENVAFTSAKMPWYKGETVLEAIDLFEKDKGIVEKPLRFPIQDVYKFNSRRIIAGRIESGSLSVGDTILISPANRKTKIRTIESWVEKDKKDTVEAGMSVGITVEDEFFNQRGQFISHIDEVPLTGNFFRANIFWMGKNELVTNKKYKLKLVTQEVECEIFSVNKAINAATLEAVDNVETVKPNGVAQVIIRTKEPVCFDEFINNEHTGRFVLVDGFDVSGGGIISGLVKEPEKYRGKLIKDNFEIAASSFDEYYFIISEGIVRNIQANTKTYYAGDVVPVAGETYSYSHSFDIFDLRSGLAAKIRDAKLVDIVSIDNYKYNNLPVINVKGFAVRINTQKDLDDLINEFSKISIGDMKEYAEFSNRWFDFGKNRTIVFKDDISSSDIEYRI